MKSVQTIDQFIQNDLDTSNPPSLTRTFCNSDVIDSTILTFADSRSPGARFENASELARVIEYDLKSNIS
jgi:hypothetical protein